MEKSVDEFLDGVAKFIDIELRLNKEVGKDVHIELAAREALVAISKLRNEFKKSYAISPKIKISNFLGHFSIKPE